MINLVLGAVGALSGALISGGAVALTSVIRGKPIDWKSVGAAALGGAVVGGIGGLTLGAGALAGTAALRTTGMVVAGASGAAVEQASDNAFHGRELGEGVAESAAVGGVLGFIGGGARMLQKPLTRVARNPAVRRVVRQLVQRGRALPQQALQSLQRNGPLVAQALRRRAGQIKIDLALGRRQLTDPLVKAGKRYVTEPFAKHVSDPFTRSVLEPSKRALAPFAARIGRTRAGQATQKLWGRYLQALERNPVRTKALTSAGIGGAGDLIAQATDDVEGIDLQRTAFIAGFGLVYGGPVGHYWFNAVDKIVPGGGAKAMLAKVLLDQGIMAPVGTGVFFTSRGVIQEGKSLEEAWRSAKDDTINVVPKGWLFWAPFHAANFSKVPLNLRKPVADAAGLVWGVIFSRIAFAEEAPADAPPTDTTGTSTSGPQADTRRVSNEREADLDGLIDAFTPRSTTQPSGSASR
ncbi:MAG: Mpv17/PMP22 family protein [Planctomycetes bacterium]|nr:Mpv17/PMP22 family protein [Planctomycetota bacterium]